MGLMNDIFRRYILSKMKNIDGFMKHPEAVQDRVLKNLILRAQSTEWGKAHSFKSIRTYNDFRRLVPIQDYNSMKPFIERTMQGEQNILWSGDIRWFAKSSGTTDDKSKFIPVSRESLYGCHYKAGKDMYCLYYNMNPKANLAGGKTLVLGGSHQMNKMNRRANYGDLSAVLIQNAPLWAELKRVPSLAITLMDNWEEKVEKMANATINHRVTNILGVPTWTVVLIKYLFEMTGKDDLSEIWPSLELYIHGGVSFTPYEELFHKLIRGSNMHYMESYNASEGFFGMQDEMNSKDLLLMLDYGIFYEFIPAAQKDNPDAEAIPLQAVELDKDYAVVISSNSGLWRYFIGDTVKFYSKDPYRIRVSGRTKHYINAFGEEVIIENAEKALALASLSTDCIVSDFTAAPVYFSSGANGAHEWLIEFDKAPADLTYFIQLLDQNLKNLNSDYEAKRHKDIALRMPIVRMLKKGTFYNWMKKRGKLGGQNKVPRLFNTRQFVDDIIKFVNEQGNISRGDLGASID